MTASLAAIPAVQFTDQQIWNGGLAAAQARAAREHGPIFRWSVATGFDAGRDFVFMVGPAANRFVLHTHRDHFSHALGWTPIIGPDLGTGLLNMDDPEHAVHRKMWNPAFTGAYMATYLPLIERVIAERSADWPRRGVVDVWTEAREITFDIAAGALAGFETGTEVDRLRQLFYVLLHGFDPDAGTFESFWQRRQATREELNRMLLGLIAARRQAAPSTAPRDVLSLIVHARDEEGATLSDAQVLAHLNILLVAGHETTTTLAAWTLRRLATEREQRERLLRELDDVFRAGEPMTVDGLRRLRSLDYFVREVGRLHAPVLNVPRGVVKDFEFGGYHVPAGTPVRLALAAGHLLPDVFAEPERFDPLRFAPPREEDKQPYALVTFGGGPRICIGVNVAQIETKALAVHALQHFRLEALSDQQPVNAGHWTAVVPGGIPLRVHPAAERRI